MERLKVVYTNGFVGQFYCKSTAYKQTAVHIITTDDEYIVIPYYNVYIIRELGANDDGSV